MHRERVLPVGALAVLVVTVSILLARDSGRTGVLAFGVGALVVAACAHMMFRSGSHTPWPVARDRVAPGHAVVLWKPGCPYCERLLRSLGKDERVTWVNVWEDEEASLVVRGLNDGDEYVPTAIVGDDVLRNPSADELTAALGDAGGRVSRPDSRGGPTG